MAWHFLEFNQLSNNDLYEILRVRQEVFVVEQNINYVDADNVDQNCVHVFHKDDNGINAYARILPVSISPYNHISFGRVLTAKNARKFGLGKELISKSIDYIKKQFPNETAIIISAQEYLENFYKNFGFETISEPYIEEEILHVKMKLLLN
tara:strand:+ start:272 stop:724 length:453 start_codon:yes stop_codon:yes gene_type:complete